MVRITERMERLVAALDERLDAADDAVVWAVSLAGIAVVGVLDYITGVEASFALFYLFPVSVAAWWIGGRAGTVCAVASSVVWFLANDVFGEQFKSAFLALWNASIRLAFFLIVTFLLVRIHAMFQRERALSRVDYLTGAYNVRAFHAIAEAECLRATRYPQPLTLAYIDLDGFKKVNDQLGHNVGDKVLHVVAQTLRGGVRRPDTVARLGGDEFALLLPQTDLASAQIFLPRLREELLAAMQRNGWQVTFSIGALTCPTAPASLGDVVSEADELMYDVKRSGKNAIRYGVYRGPERLGDSLARTPTPEKGGAPVIPSVAGS
ncbi:MAG: GGDEF domain-containing protein [Burkholderiales bacterium]